MHTGKWKQLVLASLAAVLFTVPAYAEQLRVEILNACPNNPPEADESAKSWGILATLLLPELISAGVDIASTALDEASKTKTATLIASSPVFNIYQINSDASLSLHNAAGCLIISSPASKKENAAPKEWVKKAKLDARPDFYFEIALRGRPNDGFTLTPVLLSVARPLQEGGVLRKTKRGYAIAIALKDASSLSAYGAAAFTFEDVGIGTWTADGRYETQSMDEWPAEVAVGKMPLNEDMSETIAAQKAAAAPYLETNTYLKSKFDAANPAAVPRRKVIANDAAYLKALENYCAAIKAATPPGSRARIGDERCPYSLFVARRDLQVEQEKSEQRLGLEWAEGFYKRKCEEKKLPKNEMIPFDRCALPAPKARGLGATQISVSVVESSEASAFLQTLAKAFGKKKDDIATAINDKYNPARREQLADAAAVKDRDARDIYRIAMLTVQQLEAQLGEAFDKNESTRAGLRIQIAQACIAANKAALAAGQTMPFPEFD